MLKLVITDGQREINCYDFGRPINLKIYDENDAAYDYTAYTPYVVIEDNSLTKYLDDITPSSSTPATGVLAFSFSSTNLITVPGYYYIKVELRTPAQGTAPTTRISTYPVRITAIMAGTTKQ